MGTNKIPSTGACRSARPTLPETGAVRLFMHWIPTLETVFHKVVEKSVDNRVDKSGKSALIRLLDQIA